MPCTRRIPADECQRRMEITDKRSELKSELFLEVLKSSGEAKLAVNGTSMLPSIWPGDVLEVVADCATFEKDVKEWCTRSKKVMLWMKSEGNAKRCQIQF